MEIEAAIAMFTACGIACAAISLAVIISYASSHIMTRDKKEDKKGE